jgi:cellulose synthase (UDP-forming)
LLVVEIFNLIQAFGFWWTLLHDKPSPQPAAAAHYARVDVFVPRYDEPVQVWSPLSRQL